MLQSTVMHCHDCHCNVSDCSHYCCANIYDFFVGSHCQSGVYEHIIVSGYCRYYCANS